MSFALYKTSNYQSYEDGDYYQFFIINDTLQKTIFVHNGSIPKELKAFGCWIAATKERLKHFPIDAMVFFDSLKYFLPITVPLPTIGLNPKSKETSAYNAPNVTKNISGSKAASSLSKG